MDDLISRSALIKDLNQEEAECEDCMIMPSWHSALKILDEQPTVDAVPVVHAEWERIPYSFAGGYRCSCCGQKSLERTFNYCGNCGADMRKKVQDA